MKAPTRWPLLVIGASAGVAVWSGWVGLGGLTGFGVIHPLPGIANDVTVNTAISLPISMEAYAIFALSIATSTRVLDVRARRFAGRSAFAALVLGSLGQVAFHLMVAAGWTVAPWWITAFVSCIPVGVLGTAALLWHLTTQSTESTLAESTESTPDRVESTESTSTEPESTGPTESTLDRVESTESTESPAVGGSTESTPTVVPLRSVPSAASTQTQSTGPSREKLAPYVGRITAAMETGDLDYPPVHKQVMERLEMGSSYARAAIRQIKDDGWKPQAEQRQAVGSD